MSSRHIIEIVYLTRYAGSGVINTVLGFAVIFSAMALGVSPEISNAAGYSVGFVCGFVLSKKIVFRSKNRLAMEGVRYLISFIIAFGLNYAALNFALSVLNVNPYSAQIIATICYTLIMYILTRWFVFSSKY